MVYINNYSISVRDLVISVIVLAAFIALLVRAIRKHPPRSKAIFLDDRMLIQNPDLITDAVDAVKDIDDMDFEEFEEMATKRSALSDVTFFYHDIKRWTVKSWSDINDNLTTVKIYVTTNRKQTHSLDFSRKTVRNLRQYMPDKEEKTWISKIVTSPWPFVICMVMALCFLYLVFSMISPTLHP